MEVLLTVIAVFCVCLTLMAVALCRAGAQPRPGPDSLAGPGTRPPAVD